MSDTTLLQISETVRQAGIRYAEEKGLSVSTVERYARGAYDSNTIMQALAWVEQETLKQNFQVHEATQTSNAIIARLQAAKMEAEEKSFKLSALRTAIDSVTKSGVIFGKINRIKTLIANSYLTD